jgi:hypothetical protein
VIASVRLAYAVFPVAVTVYVKVPLAVGVPESVPFGDKVSPGGVLPDVTA